MATLSAIREAIAALLADLDGIVSVYARVQDATNVPCVVVDVAPSDFDVSMGRGTDTWNLDLHILVSKSDAGLGQSLLDEYVSGAGSKSVRERIFKNRKILPDSDAHVTGLIAYNGQYDVAAIDYVGATVRCVVHTKGTE